MRPRSLKAKSGATVITRRSSRRTWEKVTCGRGRARAHGLRLGKRLTAMPAVANTGPALPSTRARTLLLRLLGTRPCGAHLGVELREREQQQQPSDCHARSRCVPVAAATASRHSMWLWQHTQSGVAASWSEVCTVGASEIERARCIDCFVFGFNRCNVKSTHTVPVRGHGLNGAHAHRCCAAQRFIGTRAQQRDACTARKHAGVLWQWVAPGPLV